MDKKELIKLGTKICYLRKLNKLSQLELSLKTGLTTRTISRLECGEIDPKMSTLYKIANALNINIQDIFNYSL